MAYMAGPMPPGGPIGGGPGGPGRGGPQPPGAGPMPPPGGPIGGGPIGGGPGRGGPPGRGAYGGYGAGTAPQYWNLPKKPFSVGVERFNPYKGYPGFQSPNLSPEAAQTGRIAKQYMPGGIHWLPPDQMQRMSDAAIAYRGQRSMGQGTGIGQGLGMSGSPLQDYLKKLLGQGVSF